MPWAREIDLVDHHPRRDLAVDVVGELGGFLLRTALLLVDVWLQAAVEVVHTYAGIDNRDDDQEQGDDGEECHRGTSRQVLTECSLIVHAEEFEAKVAHGRE